MTLKLQDAHALDRYHHQQQLLPYLTFHLHLPTNLTMNRDEGNNPHLICQAKHPRAPEGRGWGDDRVDSVSPQRLLRPWVVSARNKTRCPVMRSHVRTKCNGSNKYWKADRTAWVPVLPPAGSMRPWENNQNYVEGNRRGSYYSACIL